MIGCPACMAPLPAAAVGTPGFENCPDCRTPLRVRLFPAAFRPRETASGAVAAPAEATCFFHETKRATVPCDGCGRFLCALCDLEVGSQHLCPQCAAKRLEDPAEDRFVRQRTLWDSAALALAVYPPLLCFYPGILGAPAALFLAIRHWRSPGSLLPRTRARFVLAIVISSAQILFWISMFGFLLFSVAVGA